MPGASATTTATATSSASPTTAAPVESTPAPTGSPVASASSASEPFDAASELNRTAQEVVDTFVNKVFNTFGKKAFTEDGDDNKLSLEEVTEYMATRGAKEDIWDVFGRSMLKDFAVRRKK
jgi:hypothetical protein